MRFRPNCIHADNWVRCKHPAMRAPWWIAWLYPKGRPLCVLLSNSYPQDGNVTCQFQEHCPRPKGPPPPARDA